MCIIYREFRIKEILSFLEKSDFGWQGDTYQLYNRCLRYERHCRQYFPIPNNLEATKDVFKSIFNIFFDNQCGAITTFLFGYCLASLFISQLKEHHRNIPYLLQIACKRNSNTYRLVHEIVHICDVNTGLFEGCNNTDYIECNHDHMIVYPSDNVNKPLSSLLYYRDIPIIVEGYENEKLYDGLLRETANISGKTKRLDLKDKFNILPIFLCPRIHSQFQNILSMDLTNLDLTDEYLELIYSKREMLGSWALMLVKNAKKFFGPNNSTAYNSDPKIEKQIESRRQEDELPLLYDIKEYIKSLQIKNSCYTKLSSKDVTNIGYIAYFFSHYMDVFKSYIQLSNDQWKINPNKLCEKIKEKAIETLFELHKIYSPALPDRINIDMDSSDKSEVKRINRKGASYAKDIVKYYQSYGVSIQISSDAQYRDGRYIFPVKLMPGTDRKLISRFSENVRLMLQLEVFITDIKPTTINLIVSEKPLSENSLMKILESDEFKENKMEIPYAVGYDVMGEMVIADIAEFPHLLIGGTSNSGKSSALHSLLMSIVCKQPKDKVRLLLLDFGASSLKIFDKVPHMLRPTIRSNKIKDACDCLKFLQRKMNERIEEKDSYDERTFASKFQKWPTIICVIDEFPALINQLASDKSTSKFDKIVEDLLNRARKVKIHLILAAQNSSKGSIKIRTTNLGARIAFRCTNQYDSQAIIGTSDAVNLAGKGSMYFKCEQHEGLKRLQGSYMSPEDIIRMLDSMNFDTCNIHGQFDEIKYEPASLPKLNEFEPEPDPSEDTFNKTLAEIIIWALGEEKLSNNKIKKNFQKGYDVADKFLKQLEKLNLIT